MLMVAIGHQAGLAIENTVFYNDKIQAERLAAVGQTIATLSHHIKNILQGIRGGSYLIDLGLNEKDESIVRRGWTIVEKNQTQDLQPGHGHALVLQGPRAGPGARRPERDRRRGRRADAVARRGAGRRARVAARREPARGPDRPRRHPPRRAEHRHQRHRRHRGRRRTPRSPSRPSGTPTTSIGPGHRRRQRRRASTRPTSPRSSRSSPRPRAPAAPGWACPSRRRSSASTAAGSSSSPASAREPRFVIELPMSREPRLPDRGRGADDDRLSPARSPDAAAHHPRAATRHSTRRTAHPARRGRPYVPASGSASTCSFPLPSNSRAASASSSRIPWTELMMTTPSRTQ